MRITARSAEVHRVSRCPVGGFVFGGVWRYNRAFQRFFQVSSCDDTIVWRKPFFVERFIALCLGRF
jgi:hypothetical protein